ncbi:CHAT domain-containing protein, partial [Arthrospira platensis SPKY1]|nr:CHAT domain-containing protein [Arthrospira platensis SPKY1]
MAPFADGLPPMAGSPKMGSDWPALPFTKTEVDSLRAWFPTLPLYGAQATKEQFVALASQYAVLHLPTHGKIGLQAEEAFLAFAPQAEGRGQERLHLKALYNIP